MAWQVTGDRPLPEPMMTQFKDEYMNVYEHMRQQVAMGEIMVCTSSMNHSPFTGYWDGWGYEMNYTQVIFCGK